ncbi:WD40 repeat-like protein [Imleria badia]|nr:WD40 repeat-like protein [Imleria badia]
MTPPSAIKEPSLPIEIDVGSNIYAVKFTANSEYLVTGDDQRVRVWRTKNGQQIGTMPSPSVVCLAVSKDGQWIAAGSSRELSAWNAETHKQSFALEIRDVIAVDFSPDSTRLVSACLNNTATVWDITRRIERAQTLHHNGWMTAAKYSPRGHRIATATRESVRVWDSSNGRLLVEILSGVTPNFNTGLLWFSNHLFVVSDSTIKVFEASSGSPVAEWPVPYSDRFSCIALSRHGEFMAYSTERTVTFWDTATHTQLRLIQHPRDILSVVFSPDDRFLALGGRDGKFTIQNLEDVLLPSYSTLPLIDITSIAFDSGKWDQLANSEASLTVTITKSRQKDHLAFANRALVRAHLQHWDLAIDDATKSINICPSIIGYIAKSVALIRKGEKAEGCRVYDLVFRHCHRNEVDFLLLIKAVVLFMAGEHEDAVLRVGDLIATVSLKSIYFVVQAYMYLLLGNLCMQNRDYAGAILLFERARPQMRYYLAHHLFTITFISGWQFDGLDVKIRQRLGEALYVAGRTKDAAECLLKLLNTFDEDVDSSQPIISEWVSDFTHRCLSTSESNATRHGNPPVLQVPLDSQISTALLREWAKATMAGRSWKDALVTAAGVSISFGFYMLCGF